MAIANCFNNSGGTASESSTSNRVFNEDLSSQLNGSRTVFAISQTYQTGSISLYYNGIKQTGTFTESGASQITITFDAPQSGESLSIDFNPQ